MVGALLSAFGNRAANLVENFPTQKCPLLAQPAEGGDAFNAPLVWLLAKSFGSCRLAQSRLFVCFCASLSSLPVTSVVFAYFDELFGSHCFCKDVNKTKQWESSLC